jgi:hypothetical protein
MTTYIHTYKGKLALARALRKLSMRYGGRTRLVDAARAEAQRLGRKAAA